MVNEFIILGDNSVLYLVRFKERHKAVIEERPVGRAREIVSLGGKSPKYTKRDLRPGRIINATMGSKVSDVCTISRVYKRIH
jgi:hypothetical protein